MDLDTVYPVSRLDRQRHLNNFGRVALSTVGAYAGNRIQSVPQHKYPSRYLAIASLKRKFRSRSKGGSKRGTTSYPSPRMTPRLLLKGTPKNPSALLGREDAVMLADSSTQTKKQLMYGKGRYSAKSNSGSRRKKARKASKRSYKSTKKTNKRKSVSTEAKFLRKGYVQTREYGSQETAPNCVYVGHCSAPADTVLENVCCALIKALFALVHDNIISFSDLVNGSVNTAAIDLLTENVTTGALGNNLITLVGKTYKAIALELAVLIRAFFSTSSDVNLEKLVQLRLFQDTKGIEHSIWLKDCFVEHITQSTLKIQNRSKIADTAGTDENALNVDNVPVIGRMYSTSGTGFQWVGRVATTGTRPFYGHTVSGYIVKDSAENNLAQLSEPPHGSMFKAKSAGIKLGPGQIITNYLTFKRTKMDLHKFCEKLYPQLTSYFGIRGTGNSTMFGLEHLMKTDANGVTLGYEVNQKHMTIIKSTFRQKTAADFTSVIAAPT